MTAEFVQRYTLALITAALALAATIWLQRSIGFPSFMLLIPAVIFTTLNAGVGPGILATVSSAVGITYLAQPAGSFSIYDPADLARIIAFVGVSAISIVVAQRQRQLGERLLANERRLSEVAERFRVSLTHLPIVVYNTDLDLRYTWIGNPKPRFADRLLGRRDDEVLPAEQVAGLVAFKREVLETGRGGRRELPLDFGDGVRWFDVAIEPLREGGELRGLTAVALDITDRKGTDEALRESERRARAMAEEVMEQQRRTADAYEREREARKSAQQADRIKEEFLATLSHELRTPLNAVLGWSQLLCSRTLSPERQTHAATVIERNARALRQLVDDLLDVSRITRGRIRLNSAPVRLAEIVRPALESIHPAADAKGVRLSALLDEDAGPVLGDPERLQQVTWNLLSNAVKFTPPGGAVAVRVSQANGVVRLLVQDSGIGISREFLPAVFDPFRQAAGGAHGGGLGLGLAIVKQLVELHGGKVDASSDGPGAGATFEVQLPVFEPMPGAGPAPGGGPDPPGPAGAISLPSGDRT